ncbi:MAG: hypothetical protein ABI880_03060 [Acidobacteriota bacterium]
MDLRRLTPRVLPALALLLCCTTVASADALRGLSPGQFDVLTQTVPVNVVFVGYERGDIDLAAIRQTLPATYDPAVRYPQFYGLNGRAMGLSFRFAYRFDFKDDGFERRFFSFLTRTGVPGAPTAFQTAYNAETKNVLDVTGPVLYIDAPSVEQYLQSQDGARRDGYTIYFINWFGRSDFKFHVYSKTDETDPDTKVNFGTRGSRQMIAWGGSASRTWFYDLSAGPESWTNNWMVDDDQSEYHMPPVWEYATPGYRPPAQLSQDLGLVARFVAIDLLFTTSPLYDPLVTAPDVGGSKVAHVAMLQEDPANDGLSYFNANFMKSQMRSFQPYYPWRVGVSNTAPIDPGAKKALDIFAGTVVDTAECWAGYGDPFAQMFCYFDANLGTYVPSYSPKDYVGEIFAFNALDASMGSQFGLLGFADDNWVDGTQSYVFMFDYPAVKAAGFGFTSTGVHEFGHHLGMSHPHDGYDPELGLDFGAAGQFEFTWSGDESATVMHYLALSNSFGRFDKDNAYRWETAGYLNLANALAGDVLASSDSFRVRVLLAAADLVARGAQSSFANWDYLNAAASARLAYTLVAAAAHHINAATPTLTAAHRPLPDRRHPDGCWVRFPLQ